MRQLKTVFKFELMNYYKNKIFVGVTIGMIVVLGILLFFPRIMEFFDGGDSQEGEDNTAIEDIADGEMSKIAFVDNAYGDGTVFDAISGAFSDYKVEKVNMDLNQLKSSVENGDYDKAIVLNSKLEYVLITNKVGMYDSSSSIIDDIVLQTYKYIEMKNLGINDEEIEKIMSAIPTSEVITLGKDQFQTYWFAYAAVFALYMSVIMYGQLVATSVATEKSSKAMEMLITSAKPVNLIFGKVLGTGIAGISQMVVVVGSAFLFYNLNTEYWGENMIISALFNITTEALIVSLLAFILGFFFYAFIFGALGSLATRTEDINASATPITMIFVVSFLIVMFSMNSGNVDSTLMKVCTMVPFTSPLALIVRVTMGEMTIVEKIISIVILIASTIGIGILAAKIYQMGVLLYGKSLKLTDLIKMKAKKKA